MKSFRVLPVKAAIRTALFVMLGTGFAIGVCPSAQAQNLIELYESAKAYDANYQGAKALFEANKYKADESLAGLLPSVTLSTSDQHQTVNAHQPSNASYQQLLGTHSATLTAIQPLYLSLIHI